MTKITVTIDTDADLETVKEVFHLVESGMNDLYVRCIEEGYPENIRNILESFTVSMDLMPDD